MGWNGSGGAAATPKAPVKKGGAKPNLGRGILIGLAAVAIGLGVMYFVREGERPVEKNRVKKSEKIKEVTPAIVPNSNSVSKAAESNSTSKVREPKPRKTYVDARGVLRYEGGMVVRKPPVREIHISDGRPKIFSHLSEIEIQGILEIEPGDFVLGTPIFPKDFEADFLKSCEEPIIVTDEDDEYTASMKRAMIETKIELRDRMAKGEKLTKILTDARDELQRLGQYREELSRQLESELKQRQEENPDMTREEARDYVDAANKMLKGKGLPPITMPAGMFRRAMRKSRPKQKK